jgi:hypothetical protein
MKTFSYKNSVIIKLLFVAFIGVFLLIGQGVSANQPPVDASFQTPPADASFQTPPLDESGEPTQGSEEDYTRLKNPLGDVESIPDFVETLLRIVLLVGVPLVALAIIYSGFLFVAAQGNPKKLEEARTTFLYTLVGAAIVLGAVVIAQAIGGTIEQLRA